MTAHDIHPPTEVASDTAAASRRNHLLVLAAGLLFVVSLFLEGYEGIDEGASTDEVRRHLEDSMDVISLQVLGETLAVFGLLLLVVGLRALARPRSPEPLLMDLTLVAGALSVVWVWLQGAVDMIPLVAADDDGKLGHYPGDTLQALDLVNRLGETFGDISTVPRGLFVIAVSLLILRTRMLARFIGWFGLFVGGASLLAVPATAWHVAPLAIAWFVGLFGFVLWVLAVSVASGVRAARGERPA